MPRADVITSPDDPKLDTLCEELTARTAELDKTSDWPAEQLELCGRFGVYQWFLPQEWGGQDWSELDIVRGYLRLSASCLTTTFIITQRSGACRRIVEGAHRAVKSRLLPGLASGATFATVGISHLTTSRRHLGRPALRAEETRAGFVLDGFSPWVTGAAYADVVVLGAQLDDARQILVALPAGTEGVTVPPPAELVGLSASQTGEIRLDHVHLSREWLLAGPEENIMKGAAGAKTGGLQTSTLAVGLAASAIAYLEGESKQRADLSKPTAELRRDHAGLEKDLLALAAGKEVCTNEALRARANSLVLRATQAALAAAKGAGYVVGHPAGRMAREALFFLVWSCPAPVMQANLCELAGLE
ncbi:MAG: acyl-CoA dehydrogenase family protein [Pirellulales bacterium]